MGFLIHLGVEVPQHHDDLFKIYSTLFNLSFGLPNSCGENDGNGKTTAAFHRCFNTAVFSRCADGLVISLAVT